MTSTPTPFVGAGMAHDIRESFLKHPEHGQSQIVIEVQILRSKVDHALDARLFLEFLRLLLYSSG
jgi:hypothetical protein